MRFSNPYCGACELDLLHHHVGLVASNDGFQQAAGDSVAIGIAFLLLILPRLTPTHGRWLVALYLTSIYLDSGIHKLLSPMWGGGFGVAAPMTLPSLVWIPTNWMAWFPSWVWHFMGYGVVGFEVLFGPLYLWKRTRFPALITGILLHLGISIVYPIPSFGWIMIALYAALLPVTWQRPPGRLFRAGRPVKTIALNPGIVTACAVLWGLAVASVYTPAAYLPVKVFRKAAWLTAGIASHEVFAEDAFLHYDYQLRLVGPDGTVTPYSRGNLLAWGVRDRIWELWWKRTQHRR
jgi:hypothetical protein